MKKQYNTIKISAQQLQTANMICASGLTGLNSSTQEQIIGNGGKTSGGSAAGFDGVDARGTNGANEVFNFD